MRVCGMYLGVCVFMCVVWYQVCGVRVWGYVCACMWYVCVVWYQVYGVCVWCVCLGVCMCVCLCVVCVWCSKSPQGLVICCRGGTSW